MKYQILTKLLPKSLAMKKLLTLIILLANIFSTGFVASTSRPVIAVTGAVIGLSLPVSNKDTTLASFTNSLSLNGNPRQVVGVYQYHVLEAQVIQQPSSNPGFVSGEADKATQFGMASQYGVTALLAHNNLLGENFFKIQKNQNITLIYGDGHTSAFRVADIRRYQALNPTSPYSTFLDLDNGNEREISANDLFYSIYTTDGRLVLQTCIEKDGELSWGRLFIIAEPAQILTNLFMPNYSIGNNLNISISTGNFRNLMKAI